METTDNSAFFIIEDLDDSIDSSTLERFLQENNIKNITFKNIEINSEKQGDIEKKFAKIDYPNEMDVTQLDDLEGKILKGEVKFKIRFTENRNISKGGTGYRFSDFKEDEKIPYNMKYEEHCTSHFIQSPGDQSLKFIDQRTIDKQRGIIKHFLTKIGTNILSGSGIMNVSLPISIFDERSLLEVFAHQMRLSPYFLEKAGETDSPIDKLKFTTAFAISRIHMSVTQMKPFNPIWGETFQCKIGDSKLYMEQTSHHPPIYHFLHTGKNFKSYGYQEAVASTGANSVTAKTKGIYTVEYSDGTKHLIYPCVILINGTLIGERSYAVIEKTYIVDEKNDFISYIEFNPDERGTISKLFSRNKNFPDYFK